MRRSVLARFLAPLALALALAGCGTGAPPDETASEAPPAASFRSASVDEALEGMRRAAQTRGFSPEGEPQRGFVLEGSIEVRELSFVAGSCYALLAAGSTGLREIDVALYLADGTEAERDGATGRTAALVYCPVHAGTYYVTVHASAGNGLFAVRVVRGPTGLDVTATDLLPAAQGER